MDVKETAALCKYCGSEKKYNCQYDAYYCELCNKWLDDNCSDSECVYCTSRPEKPTQVSN